MFAAWHHSTKEHLRKILKLIMLAKTVFPMALILKKLVTYMTEARQAEMVSTIFKLVDLCRLYSTRIEERGVLK